MQDWPAYPNAPLAMRFATSSRSATSGSTTTAALPPSSSVTRRRKASSLSFQPTAMEPVNVSIRIRSSEASFSASAPRAGITDRPPAGRPASARISARSRAGPGVWVAGLSTTGHPAATAGASLWATRLRGKLKGVMASTGPMGTRRTRASRPAPDRYPSRSWATTSGCRATRAASVKVSRQRSASTVA